MFELDEKTKEKTNEMIQRNFGMSYEEFDSLDIDEQLRLIEEHRKKQKRKRNGFAKVMIGSGDNALFVSLRRGKRHLLDDGTVVRAGRTPEEYRREKEDRLDEIAYGKPVALVKKIKRKIRGM